MLYRTLSTVWGVLLLYKTFENNLYSRLQVIDSMTEPVPKMSCANDNAQHYTGVMD
jgi:hypothetical protein